MNNPLRYVHSWPTVAIVAVVCAFVGVIFHFADAEGKASLLGVLCVLGTTVAAIARHAFAVPKDKPPTRLDDDNDDPGEGGEVLAEEPPTKPLPRTPRRVTLSPRAAVKDSLTARFRRPFVLLTAAFVLALSVPFFVTGCSPSALQTHATIASVTGHVFDTACAEVEAARSREQHAIADGPLDRDESRVAVDAVRARWAPALASCELAADTHDAWVTTLALAAAGAPFTLADGLALAQQALSVWQSLSATLMIAGVEMPAVPPELVALVGGGL